jgi:hypothetical protein
MFVSDQYVNSALCVSGRIWVVSYECYSQSARVV